MEFRAVRFRSRPLTNRSKIMKEKTEKVKNSTNIVYEFNSITELLETAKKCTVPVAEHSTSDWQYGELYSWEKTEKYLRAGKGLSSVRRISRKYRHEFENTKLSEITQRVTSCKRKRRYNDNDGDLDLERVMAGSDDYWTKIERNGEQKTVRIGINFSISCGNDTESFSKIVALGAVFAETLESLGYGVEIYGCCLYKSARKRNKRYGEMGMTFPVKQVTEPLDFDRIYSIGLQGLLRNAKFRAEQYLTGNYGGSCVPPSQDFINLAGLDVIVSRSWTEGNEVEQIVQAIENL